MDLPFHSFKFKAMGSPCEFHAFARDDAWHKSSELAQAEVLRLEKKYSRYRTDSVLSEINKNSHKAPMAVDSETAGLLNYARMCFEQSDGLFDITSGVLREVWDFKSDNPVLPNEDELNTVLKRVGFNKVLWDGETLQLEQGMELDFGGMVKEYAADRAKQVFLQQGITSGLVDLGGDMAFMGSKPNGAPWAVGIRDGLFLNQAACTLQLSKGAIATSGAYERYFVLDGKRYCHLLNPKTGKPVSYLASVSVMSGSCLVCGSMATIAMLKQREGLPWLQQEKASFILQTNDGELFDSHGALQSRAYQNTA